MDSEPMVPTPMDTDPTDMLPTPTMLLARGMLMPMLTTDMAMLLPMLMELMPMVPTPMDTDPMDMLPTPTTLLARGLLMLSPRLMLMPTTMVDTMDSDPMVLTPMDTDPTDMLPTPTTLDTTDTSKLPFPTKIPPESKNQSQQPQQ